MLFAILIFSLLLVFVKFLFATPLLAADGHLLRKCPARHPVGGNPRLASASGVAFCNFPHYCA